MSPRNKYLILITILCLANLLFCLRNNNPLTSKYEYIYNWPDSLICNGIGSPNKNLPLPQQRAGALRAAKMDLLRNLLETAYSLPISNTQTINNLTLADDKLKFIVDNYMRSFRVINTSYDSSGDVLVEGMIKTDSLKIILISYIH